MLTLGYTNGTHAKTQMANLTSRCIYAVDAVSKTALFTGIVMDDGNLVSPNIASTASRGLC